MTGACIPAAPSLNWTRAAAAPVAVRAPARPLFRPLRAMHCPLRNLTHASRALTGVAGRWQAGVGEVPRILLDEIQARAPPDAIVHVSQAG